MPGYGREKKRRQSGNVKQRGDAATNVLPLKGQLRIPWRDLLAVSLDV